MNIGITLDKRLLDNADSDFFHYGYGYELAKCEYGTWRVNSLGELKCHYTDEEKGIDTWNYADIVNYYVRNNDELAKAVDEDKIYVLNDVKEAFPLMRKLSDGETYVLLENDLPDLFNE